MFKTAKMDSPASSSGSEPTTPEFSPSMATGSAPKPGANAHRRRFAIHSVPSPPAFHKRRPIRDVLIDRMGPLAPSVLTLFIALLFIFHFVTGLSAPPLPSLSFAPDPSSGRMTNREVLAEVQRWSSTTYARDRLRVFYYDLPNDVNVGLVSESHRNPPKIRDPFCDRNFYSAEHRIAQFFRDGPIRTRNASNAHFFYVPIYTTCYLLTNLPNDVGRTGRFFENAMRAVVQDYPYWNATDGRDHIFMFAQGFGARLAGDWRKYRQATFLVHNGDYEEDHFNSHKDIVVPPDLSHYLKPVGMTSRTLLPKSNFVLFGGQVLNTSISDHRGSNYSGGVRQYVQREYGKADGYRITGVRSASYVQDMMESVFCLAPHGWHKWSPRPAYSILLGCIPVIISEMQEMFLGNLLDYTALSYWVHPAEITQLDSKLRAVSPEQLHMKELAIRDVWRLFWYGQHGLAEESIMYSLYRKMAASNPQRSYL